MPKACNHCGCTEIDTDPSRGDVICTNCGTVLEDQIIVSEVQYQENATGGASVIGQFVSNDGTRAQSFRGAYGFSSEDSRKTTLENGYKKLKELGHQVRMHQSSIDTAFGFFKIAVANKFTQGRKMDYILASCLYLVCRVDPGGSEDLELMLIDFSDLIQVNVHVLGRTFVQLAAELCQNIRIVDPIIYIRRFANQLCFGDKLNKVVESATRLVARMKRDWMHTGRRPAGLCGAAILISARMHNFNRTIDQVIKVVKVCENTVRKRLLEFDSTPSAQLTIEEFDNVDLEAEQDPPCFTEGKKKSKLAQEKQLEGKLSDAVVKEMNKFQENITKSLKYKKPPELDKGVIRDEASAVKVLDEEIVKEVSGTDWEEASQTQSPVGNTDSMNNTVVVIDDDNQQQAIMKKEEVDTDSEEEDSKSRVVTKVEDGELDLTGIDDGEIDALIMSEEEVAQKSHWFNLEFGEFMKIVKEREEKKKLKEEEALKKKEKNPRAKKKRRKNDFDVDSMRAECMEILKKDMREKKFSDKINYSVLSNLGASETGDDSTLEKEPIDITDEDPFSKPQLMNRFRKSSISEPQSDRKKNDKPLKRVRIDERAIEEDVKKTRVEEAPVIKPDVIEISAEPRPYEEQEEPEDLAEEEDDEDYDDDEEEEKIISARELLSQDVSGYEEEEDEYLY